MKTAKPKKDFRRISANQIEPAAYERLQMEAIKNYFTIGKYLSKLINDKYSAPETPNQEQN